MIRVSEARPPGIASREKDARQVSDLPAANPFFLVSATRVGISSFPGHRPPDLERASRQVKDLPRIRVAQPKRNAFHSATVKRTRVYPGRFCECCK